MSHTARIWTQDQLTEALASACVLEGVSILHLGQYSDTAIRNLKAVARTMYETSGMPTIVWDKAFNLAIRIENELNADEPTDEEIETCARGFFEGTPGPTNWDAVSEVSKQAWLHAAKKALAAVNAMKTKEQQ